MLRSSVFRVAVVLAVAQCAHVARFPNEIVKEENSSNVPIRLRRLPVLLWLQESQVRTAE